MATIVLTIIIHKQKVLIIRRAHANPGNPSLIWAFPGGKVEPGETYEEAVIREGAEETGVSIRVEALIHQRVIPGKKTEAYDYLCTIPENSEATVIPDEQEVAQSKWVTGKESCTSASYQIR